MPRKYKRSNSRKRSVRKSRSKARGGAACNAVPNLPYANPCASGAQLDSEFANSMKGGSSKSTFRMRRGKKSRRSYKRRNTKRGRKSKKKQRGSGFTFNPAAAGSLNFGGLHSNVPYNDCCAPNYESGNPNPVSYGVGDTCSSDGSVANQASHIGQQSGGSLRYDCKQPNWGPECH
jgi:hypothetical protein